MTDVPTLEPLGAEPLCAEPVSSHAFRQGIRALARMLDYPDAEMLGALPELRQALAAMPLPNAKVQEDLCDWCDSLHGQDLLELQAAYVAQFDRGRSTSLLLFEHVHGESRDRGQAMVDLLAEYETAGYELDSRELPDHLPLFLEFLSILAPEDTARWIGDIRHILALLTARLQSKDCQQALVPLALLSLIGAEAEVEAHRDKVKEEPADDTPAAIDAVWEEEAVRFSAESDQDCSLQSAEGRRLAERSNSVPADTIRLPDIAPQASTGGLS
ncbi:nitrate reductase molybdenum cofactor assembly chaperone [Halomonas sp. V046]|uniref:nitrate reductase molybdenum cofactor assembly chaperone n=1 Tax=Halomonas sp. V046 TaxID=3459611 RepID=UPI00404505F1